MSSSVRDFPGPAGWLAELVLQSALGLITITGLFPNTTFIGYIITENIFNFIRISIENNANYTLI